MPLPMLVFSSKLVFGLPLSARVPLKYDLGGRDANLSQSCGLCRVADANLGGLSEVSMSADIFGRLLRNLSSDRCGAP